MVEYAGSPTYAVYVDVTLTRSKVKVTGLLNFRQLAKPCMLAAMTAAPLRRFLVCCKVARCSQLTHFRMANGVNLPFACVLLWSMSCE